MGTLYRSHTVSCHRCRASDTVACQALLAGESVDEIAFLLGHRDANVTRAVYVRELADARRRLMRRSRMIAEFGGLFRDQALNQDAPVLYPCQSARLGPPRQGRGGPTSEARVSLRGGALSRATRFAQRNYNAAGLARLVRQDVGD